MDQNKNDKPADNDCININASFDASYWCKKFSVSPFTLFHLIKNLGNSARIIEEFLHAQKKGPAPLQAKEVYSLHEADH